MGRRSNGQRNHHDAVGYVGSILEICQERRGVFVDRITSREPARALHYVLPLNEIIYDFFDQLKSRSKGYASFDYELRGYQKSDLVKLDFLLNGDCCDALSSIVHKDRATTRARAVAESLGLLYRASSLKFRFRRPSAERSSRAKRSSRSQGRACQCIRRRHHPQEEAARKTEGGQKTHCVSSAP